jgi:hypothetical protein
VVDNLPADYVALFNDLAGASLDNTMLIPWEIWRDNFIQDAPESVARSIWEQLSPEPNQVNLDKLDLKRSYSLAIPISFIYCRQDKALPPDSFHPECRRGLKRSGSLRWTAATKSCLRDLPSWQVILSKQARTES